MADYTTIGAIEALLPESVPTDTDAQDPTRNEIKSWIVKVTAQVNAALEAGGVVVPLMDTNDLAVVDLLSSREIAYQIYLVKGYSENAQNKPLWKTWHDEFLAMLRSMEGGGRWTPLPVGAGRAASKIDVDPWFKKGAEY